MREHFTEQMAQIKNVEIDPLFYIIDKDGSGLHIIKSLLRGLDEKLVGTTFESMQGSLPVFKRNNVQD